MSDNLQCLNCGWIGHRQELVCRDDDPESFVYCPDCESAEDLEEEDDDDEDGGS